MDTKKFLILDIVLSMFLIIIIRIDITAALGISQYFNFKTDEDIATVNNITNSNNYSSGDPYIDEVYEDCITDKDLYACDKFRVLKYFHEMIPPFEDTGKNATVTQPEFALWGPVKLVPLAPIEMMRKDGVLLPGLKPDSTDSELMKLFRFTLREVERFLKSYGLAIDFSAVEPSEGGADVSESPRSIDDFFGDSLSGGKFIEKIKLLMLLTY
jgi:hypothetical protein